MWLVFFLNSYKLSKSPNLFKATRFQASPLPYLPSPPSFIYLFLFFSPFVSNLEVTSTLHSFPLPPCAPHLPLHRLLLHLSCLTPSYVHPHDAMASMDYMCRYHANFLADLRIQSQIHMLCPIYPLPFVILKFVCRYSRHCFRQPFLGTGPKNRCFRQSLSWPIGQEFNGPSHSFGLF